jgi:hypothetical protein
MRPLVLLCAMLALLVSAPAAMAAPTCQDKDGTTTRCGTASAMPVGWSLPPAEFNSHQAALRSDTPNPTTLPSALCFIVLLLALFAFLPDFDGRSDADWDEQEGDDRQR